MAESPDPWQRPAQPPAPGPGPRTRLLVWIALLLAVAVGLLQLSRMFPGAVSKQDEPYLVYMVGWLALLSAGFVFARRARLGEVARNIAIWGVIAAVLATGYAYREELGGVGARLHSELLPGDPVASANAHVLTLTQDEGGDFYVYGSANGTRIRFLVDTGASDIVLSPGDARRLGVDIGALHFTGGFETANGIGAGAPYTLNTLSVGPIQLWNVPVSINRTDMHASLLGMSFLKRLKAFEFSGRKLTLRW
jgi:aspartyl protease family protein